MVEYSVTIALLAVAVIATLLFLGQRLAGVFRLLGSLGRLGS